MYVFFYSLSLSLFPATIRYKLGSMHLIGVKGISEKENPRASTESKTKRTRRRSEASFSGGEFAIKNLNCV